VLDVCRTSPYCIATPIQSRGHPPHGRPGGRMRFLPDRATYRALLKSPGFTAVAVVSLALAIGLTTTT